MTDEFRPTRGAIADVVFGLFARRGGSAYGGEAVTQQEHALQAALLAERGKAPASLIVAALLHDVGHLLHSLPDDAPERGIDDRHEALAARWLATRFDSNVVQPVLLHVAAKRYLCATDPAYHRQLSPPSLLSLQLQGGPMSESEARDFAASPWCAAALDLRRWDDAAKVAGLTTPSLEHFVEYFDDVARCENPGCQP